jgi:hypothetical protein
MSNLPHNWRLVAVALLAGLGGCCLVFVMKQTGAMGRRRVITVACVGLLAVAVGVALLAYDLSGAGPAPWTYQAADGSFRLTLPSPAWRQAATEDGGADAAFVCRRPRMQAQVYVKSQQAKADFDRAAEVFRGEVEADPRRRERTKIREGVNPAGHRYVLSTSIETTADGEAIYVAHVLVWNAERQLVIAVQFEGLLTAQSDPDSAAEREAVEKAAEGICMSVE